jgi:hypothetical protein
MEVVVGEPHSAPADAVEDAALETNGADAVASSGLRVLSVALVFVEIAWVALLCFGVYSIWNH